MADHALVHAQDGTERESASFLTKSKLNLDLRYRYEHVDDRAFDESAVASLLRSRLTLESPRWRGFTALVEVDDVSSLGPEDYNSTENGETDFPVIADPLGTEINQAWIGYRDESTTATAGRQRIQIGNQRFIGSKPWRQNEQTYDGARVVFRPAEGVTLDASYVYNVNRIFGPENGSNPADLEGDNLYFRGDYALDARHKVAAFAFLMEFDEDPFYPVSKTANNSSRTVGLEYTGTFDWLTARASWATQTEAGDSELEYDADYYVVELTARRDAWTLRAAYEVLGADDGGAFSTPLAAAHGFQGWADKFLATPFDGIKDAWASVEGKFGAVTLAAAFHDFRAESSSTDFGTEIDLIATWQAHKRFSVQAKYASFDSATRERYEDTDKAWLTLQFKL